MLSNKSVFIVKRIIKKSNKITIPKMQNSILFTVLSPINTNTFIIKTQKGYFLMNRPRISMLKPIVILIAKNVSLKAE